MAFLTPSIIAKEALMVLENELVMANLVHRDFSKEYASVGSTITVRKPATFEATAFSSTIIVQSISEGSVSVALDKFYDTSAEVTSQQLSLDIVDFSEQVIAPMMRAHAQQMDNQIFQAVYDEVAGHTAVSSTPAIGDLANLMAQLDIQKCPITERRVVLHPITQAKYAALDAILHADKRGKSLTIDEYRIGRVLGADYYMDQNTPKWTSGISDTAGAFNGTAIVGATAATVDALTDAEVVAAGDVFKVVGSDRGYLIVTGGTVSTNSVGITFTPGLDAAIADNAVVTFQDTHRVNLAFHKNAFALVTAPLEPPLGGALSEVQSYRGVTCRVVYDYTMSSKKNTLSIDTLYGVKTLDKELAARLAD